MSTARILIVDDDPHIRETVRLALAGAGHHVEGAADGRQALEMFGSGAGWDLVLLDQRLPDMSGLDVLRNLHPAAPSVPVILLTAVESVELSGAALGTGARGYLTKPISVGELRQVVADTLGPRKEG